MGRALALLSLVLLVSGTSLLAGLAGSSLRTGRLDPLDWLLPGTIAILVLARLAFGRPSRERAWTAPWSDWAVLAAIWALIALPPQLLLTLAGIRVPLAGMALLAAGLMAVVIAWGSVRNRSGVAQMVTAAALVSGALLIPSMSASLARPGAAVPPEADSRSVVGVFTAMPLQGVAMGAAHGLPAMESIGLRSPVWQALEASFSLRALDALDDDELAGLTTLLVAQPRSLAPQELVALDAWVRAGGHAVVLADPLLHWPDPRPLAHPDRAPLTSLLDPLLTHWGLRLEAAEWHAHDDPTERRSLASGALLQLAGASRFVQTGSAHVCDLKEGGLVAYCDVGKGHALLVADADWIDDSLWTLTPARPLDPSGWTSDAILITGAWLRGDDVRVGRLTTWIGGRDPLVAGVRASLVLLLSIAIFGLTVGYPRVYGVSRKTNRDQKWNKEETKPDTG